MSIAAAVGRKFGLSWVDLDDVAAALAVRILRDFAADVQVLERGGTVQVLRTRYMQLVAEYGLPGHCCNDVADRAWGYIARAQDVETTDAGGQFAFYE